jgi:Domain of unknown function (DUF6285)
VSLHDRPTLSELLEAVRGYLNAEVVPAARDRRARFRALIAANVLAIAQREIANAAGDAAAEAVALEQLGYAGADPDEARRRLCDEIRAGRYDDPERFGAALAFARASVVRKLAVANPNFRIE